MKKKIWSNKAIVIIAVIAMLLSLGMVGCGNASDNKNAETAADVAQTPEAENEESGEEDVQQTDTAQTEEPESTPEPTQEPTLEEEVVELPEIDERYEYHLYCFNVKEPLIGLYAPEGWEYAGGSTSNDILLSLDLMRIDKGYLESIFIIEEHEAVANPLETDMQSAIPQIVFEKEEKAIIDTAFGKAQIYWVAMAFQDIYDIHDGGAGEEIQEIEGEKYFIVYREVTAMSIDKGNAKDQHQVFFYSDSYNDLYSGILEEVLPQMLEPK